MTWQTLSAKPDPKTFFQIILKLPILAHFRLFRLCRNTYTTAVANTTIMESVTLLYFFKMVGPLTLKNNHFLQNLK